MVALRVVVGAWWWWGGHGWVVLRCELHGMDDPWRPWVSCEVCGLHVGECVRVRCAWVNHGLHGWAMWALWVHKMGGMGCMWWCGGRVWAIRKVQAACGGHGGHGVHVDYLWVVCAMREVRAAYDGHGGHGVHVDYLWDVCVMWERYELHVVAMELWVVYGLCIGYIYQHVVVVFMIIDPYKFIVGYCSKILHKIRLSIGPIPLATSCFLPQEKQHPNPKTISFIFVSFPANDNSAFTIQYLFEFCFHFYSACKQFLSTDLTPTIQI